MLYRRMIHIMIGSCFDRTVCNVLEYVLKYGDRELADFFTGMTCREEKDGSLVFTEAVKSAGEDEDNTLYFNSDIDDEYRSTLSTTPTVIKKEKQNDYLKAYLVSLFDQRITINKETADNTLNICLYLPLYDSGAWNVAKTLMKAVSDQKRSIRVDLFFFAYDLAHLLVGEKEKEKLPELLPGMQKTSCRILKEAVEFSKDSPSAECLQHIVVMQNCNSDGVSLDLNPDSFVRVIGEFAISTINSYQDVFGTGPQLSDRPIVAMGLSVLNLDKYYFVRYLLSKAYVKVLEREGVDEELVDVSEPSLIVHNLLKEDDRYRFYDKFYDSRVRDLISQQLDDQTITTKAGKALDEDVALFISKITSFIDREDISLAAKKVTLAQLLGLDDDLMTGDSSNPDQLVFRDCYADCMDMFVRANNYLLDETPTDLYVPIPSEKGTVDMGKDDEGNDVKYPENLHGYAALTDKKIDFPALKKSLKDTEVEIRRWTEYIRTRQKELDELDITVKQSDEKDKVLVEGGFRYGDVVYRPVVVDNIPLELTYEPKDIPLARSLDMRRNFSPIKSQGAVGACTAFAITSVYEYILGQKGVRDTLSERYLYYNARVAALRRQGIPEENLTDNGSSYFDAFKSMGQEGISTNLLCPYGNGDDADVRPSPAAYEDGKTRLVTEAKDVKIQEKDIKTALNEGYPVMISARLYESFASGNAGFVPMPSAEEIEKEQGLPVHSSHAMVICGYSDDDKVFIVRNSWGTQFGDSGYCYMPYSYILNPELVPQACIITGVNSEKVAVAVKGDKPTVQFDKERPAIKAAIIRNLIAEAQIVKDGWMQKWSALTKDYSRLENMIVNSSVRTSLYDGTKARLEWEIGELEAQKRRNSLCESERLDALDSKFKRTALIYAISLFAVLLIFFLIFRSDIYKAILEVIPLTKIIFGVIGVSLIVMAVYYVLYRGKRRQIQDEHTEVSKRISRRIHERESGSDAENGHLGIYSDNLNVRMYLPWKVVTKLSEQGRLLLQKYQTFHSFVGNLKEWHDREVDKVKEMSPDTREPFISLLSNKTLDQYFEENSDEIVKDVRLYRLFQGGYAIKDEVIIKFKKQLKDTIVGALLNDLKEFSVYKYLSGKTTFKFLGERKFDVDQMLKTLSSKSKVFLRLDDEASTFQTESARNKVLLSSDIREDQDNWDVRFQKNFAERFPHVPIASPFKITFIQMERVPLEICLDLVDEEAEEQKKKKKVPEVSSGETEILPPAEGSDPTEV